MKTQTVVIIRHAHRDKDHGRQLDNGLSGKGRRQARRALKFFARRFGEKPDAVLWTSPKKRCFETLSPIREELGVPLTAEADLDEEGDLDAKVNRIVRRIPDSGAEVLVICSHGDWIPLFARKVLGVDVDLEKGGWLELRWSAGSPHVTWLIQDFHAV